MLILANGGSIGKMGLAAKAARSKGMASSRKQKIVTKSPPPGGSMSRRLRLNEIKPDEVKAGVAAPPS